MNKITPIVLTILFLTTKIFAQIPITVAEKTVKIGILGQQIFYYGFAQGDQMIFSFEETTGKEIKEIEITEMPSSSKFMDYRVKKLINKKINISQTGVYKFSFINAALAGRVCKIKIQRIPQSTQTINFNTAVYWRTNQDTTYVPTLQKVAVNSDTTVVETYNSSPQISSKNAINGNKNYQIIDFTLPDNTISWSFYFATGSQGKAEYEKAKISFAKSAVKLVTTIANLDPMAALALTGVSFFNKAQGDDNVKYWFLSDQKNVSLFENQKPFTWYKKGDVINEASQMKAPLKGKVYLALLNDNTIDPIKLTLKVVAIVVKQKWQTQSVNKIIIRNKGEPYLPGQPLLNYHH
ncbi:MAG: hypothetical protein EAZ15_10170 [Sphingobacteriales bacterium]|nr:MAG: hypothetical protein EAZ15_10170 [Sphingobacteriales bacterium]